MAGRLEWRDVQAPGFADVSQILRNAASSWNEGFDTLNTAFKDAHVAQSERASNAVIPQMAGIANEADIAPFLADLPNMVNPANMTPELREAVLGLRNSALGYEQDRASIDGTRASTASVRGAEGRLQTDFGRRIAQEDILMANSGALIADRAGAYNGYGAGRPGAPTSGPVPPGTAGNPRTPIADDSWLVYSNQNAIRNQPLSDELIQTMSFLPEMGVRMEVISGGETEDRRASDSGRHLHGNSVDADFYIGDRRLDWNNPDDLPIFEEITRRARANGATGIGAGDGYMGAGRMHIGFGNEAVWGDGGSRSGAPDWLIAAYEGGASGSVPNPQGGPSRAQDYVQFPNSGLDSGAMNGLLPEYWQPLVSGQMDAYTAGAGEARTAREDQQTYIDSLRQFQQDQTTFAQTQQDRARAEQARLDAEAGQAAALAAMRTASSLTEAQTMLTNDPNLNPLAVQSALASLGSMGGEGQFTPTEIAAGAPSLAADQTALDAYAAQEAFALASNETLRINKRAEEEVGDTDPATFVRDSMENLDMEPAKLNQMIQRLAEENDLSPAQVAVILTENVDRAGPEAIFQIGRKWGGEYFNEEDAQAMIEEVFDPAARRAASETQSTTEQRIASGQEAYSTMESAAREISLWAERNGGDWQSAPQELQDQFNEAQAALRQITNGTVRDNATEVVAQVNGQPMTRDMVSQLPEDQRAVVESSIMTQNYIRNNPTIAGPLLDPNLRPEEKNRIIAQLATQLGADTTLTQADKDKILSGLSQMSQGNVGMATRP